MENRFNDLSLRFHTKGFTPIEIPGLIKDVFNIFDKNRYYAIAKVNRDLEELGWGVEIIDNVTYELINSLGNNKWQTL